MKNIILCGCGALGSYIAMGIAREGQYFYLFDDDTVSSENTNGLSAYTPESIGRRKIDALAVMLRRRYNVNASGRKKTVTNSSQLPDRIDANIAIAIDCFDNIEARSYTVGLSTPTVHVSIGEQGLGAIEWDDVFKLPESGYPRGENPVCTNELGRDLILFTSTVASIIINKYLSIGVKESAYVMPNSLEIFR